MKIKVFDAIMGSGKTYNAIERMKGYLKDDIKFIYITPFLSEIDRIILELKSKNVFAPSDLGNDDFNGFEIEHNFIDDKGNYNLNADNSYRILSKRAQFLKMVAQGKSIISTHSLFMSLNKQDFSSFKNYILILDEVVTPLQVYNIGRFDLQILKNQNLITIDEDSFEVKFINENYDDSAFKEVKKLCNKSTVYYLDNCFLVWVFPIEIFKEFKEVQVLTYLFKGSLLSSYFELYNLRYEILSNYSLDELNEFKKLLNVYNGRSNGLFKVNSFSKTWVCNLSKRNANKVKEATSYVFKRVFKTKSNKNAFTTFKDFKSKLAGRSYSKGFIPINSRATNNFKDIESMAYLGNRYFDPQTVHFFKERNVHLNEDLWALGELIQWIWRGCIRDRKNMNLFIPSSRMRGLLEDWLDGKLILDGLNKNFDKAI